MSSLVALIGALFRALPHIPGDMLACWGDWYRFNDRLEARVKVAAFLDLAREHVDAKPSEVWDAFERLTGPSFSAMPDFIAECKRHGAFWRDPALRGAWFRERN